MIQASSLPDPILGESPFIRDLRARLPRLAKAEVPVLIEGETGTGKTFLSRAIHRFSPRNPRPFQIVDCGTVPDGMFLRELFGHARGAFTGADMDRMGRLEAADGGTVLLHGIQDLAHAHQTALLRVLEEGEILPLGGIQPRKVDLRFIETSQIPVADLVEKGRLRQDLFYRLQGVQIAIPPLRERRDDVTFYLEYYLREESRLLGRSSPRLDPELRQLLGRYPWPGNLRQLRHALRGMLTLEPGDRLGLRELPRDLRAHLLEPEERAPSSHVFSIPSHLSYSEQVELFQRALIQRTWSACKGRRRLFLETLGLAPHQLKYLVRKFDLNLDGLGE